MKHSLATGQLALLLGVAPIVAMLADSPSVLAQSSARKAEFAPPREAMVLTRTLRRPLPDGKEILSRRSYEVAFVAEADGFRIDGRLLDVDVVAPDALRMLANIEKDRPDSGMFPIRLDRLGKIVVSSASPDNAALQKAIELALGEMAHSRMIALELFEAQAFVQQVKQRSGFNQWPVDLFHPQVGQQIMSRNLTLPGGVTGRVTIDTEAMAQGRNGLLGSYKRTVTTDLAGDERKTYEEWSLAPADFR